MPQDANGNYYVDINPFPPQNIGSGGTVYGITAPGSNPTVGQRRYINTATGDCYAAVNGAWVKVTNAVAHAAIE